MEKDSKKMLPLENLIFITTQSKKSRKISLILKQKLICISSVLWWNLLYVNFPDAFSTRIRKMYDLAVTLDWDKGETLGWDARLRQGVDKPFRQSAVCRQFKKLQTLKIVGNQKMSKKVIKLWFEKIVISIKHRLDQIFGHSLFFSF